MDTNDTTRNRRKQDMVQAKISPELREKIEADMARLGVRNESEYVRMMLQGAVTGISDMQEVKDLLKTIIEKVDGFQSDMVEISIRIKDIEMDVHVIKKEIKNL